MHATELTTPIYLKSQPDMPWPDDPVFYLMTGDGLFLCRNHPFFKSSVPARRFPSELSWHDTGLQVYYPKIPRFQLSQILAYFIYVGNCYSAEAIVLLAWDSSRRRVRIVVPNQVATVGRNRWNDTWPIGVEYETPKGLPAGWTLYGDIHSHVDGPAYASHIDRDDEAHRPGLHVIIGRVFDDKPDILAQAVVDGTRFNLKEHHVIEGYEQPARRFPRRWLERVQIEWPGQKPWPIVQSPSRVLSADSGASEGNGESKPGGERWS